MRCAVRSVGSLPRTVYTIIWRETSMKCTHCNFTTAERISYCPNCGAPMVPEEQMYTAPGQNAAESGSRTFAALGSGLSRAMHTCKCIYAHRLLSGQLFGNRSALYRLSVDGLCRTPKRKDRHCASALHQRYRSCSNDSCAGVRRSSCRTRRSDYGHLTCVWFGNTRSEHS